jgi:hypothetical protein
VEALLSIIDEDSPVNFSPYDLSKGTQSSKLGKACNFYGIPHECLRHEPKRRFVHLTHLFNHCFRLGQFLTPGKKTEIITLPKPGKDPNFPK